MVQDLALGGLMGSIFAMLGEPNLLNNLFYVGVSVAAVCLTVFAGVEAGACYSVLTIGLSAAHEFVHYLA